MEQCIARLDVAMFNAILRESADDIPSDPISDPISDPKVLPIPPGKSSFGAGAQLKTAVTFWSQIVFVQAIESSYPLMNWIQSYRYRSNFLHVIFLYLDCDLRLIFFSFLYRISQVGNWSRWLTDLFGMDDDDSLKDKDDDIDNNDGNASFKAFHLLNALSDLLMLPKDMLLNASVRKEVSKWTYTFRHPVFKLPQVFSWSWYKDFCLLRSVQCLVHQ